MSLEWWKWRIFFILYLSYASCYFGRRSFSSLATVAIDSGVTVEQIGLIGSAMALGYSSGKLWATLAIDGISPVVIYPIILLSIGLINYLFAYSEYIPFMIACWFINGALHGVAWMPCAKLLTEWYAPSERGSWWGLVSTSSTAGSSIAQVCFPLLCATLFMDNWRHTMMLISIVPILASIITYLFVAPSPQSVGFKEVGNEISKSAKDYESTPLGRVKEVLLNPRVQMLSFSSLCIYTLRMGVTNWFTVYCKQMLGFSTIAAGGITFWMEVGGIFGSTISGWVSDRFFDRRRAPVNVIFSIGAGITIYSLQFITSGTLISIIMFAFGFFFYAPQTFLGMHAIECVDKRVVGTTMGYHGLLSGFGSAIGGYPFSKIIESFGWDGFFLSCFLAALASAVVILPLWNHKLLVPSEKKS